MVGLCPDRLILARYSRGKVHREISPVRGDWASDLRELAGHGSITVILSNHFVRYAALSGSPALKSVGDWSAYAEHVFAQTYGPDTGRWRIRVSPTGAPHCRVACAIDATLLASLQDMAKVKSIRPYLMAAFNLRRAAIAPQPSWFVVHEPLRLAVGLIAKGQWQFIRTRQTDLHWRESLADLLDREGAIAGVSDCTRVVLCSEDEAPIRLGRYDVVDLTLPQTAGPELRPHVMTLH